MHHLTHETRTTRVMDAVAAGASSQNGSVIDMAGFDAVRFIALFGALTADQVTRLKVQHGDEANGGDMADIAGAITEPLEDADSDKVLIVDVSRPMKRYVRAVVVRGTANAVIDGVIAEQYRARTLPTVQSGSVTESITVNEEPSVV